MSSALQRAEKQLGVLAAEVVGQSASRPVGGSHAAAVRLARAADLGARFARRVACGGSRAADVGVESRGACCESEGPPVIRRHWPVFVSVAWKSLEKPP